MANRTNYQKQWLKDHKDRVRELNTEWRRQHHRSAKNFYTKQQYGISLAEYEARLKSQDSRCAICSNVLSSGRETHLDHCHVTGLLRGFLCNFCNTGLGMFRDNKQVLQLAIKYLERFEK